MPPRRSARRGTTATQDPPPTITPEIEEVIAQRVADAIAAYETNRNAGSGRGSESNHGDSRGNPRICSYKEFMNCKPKSFYGTEGVIGLTRWFEKTESVFQISNCTEECKVKYSACTFMDAALSWWNGHVKTLGIVNANAMSWEDLKILMVEEYCPRGEIQKLEQEFWNLEMKGSEIAAYTNRFNDLSVLCPQLVTPEYKKVERYVWGLAPQIQGMVTASRPATFESAKQIAFRLTDQGIRQGTMAPKVEPREGRDHKRKYEDRSKERSRRDPPKRQETIAVHAVTATEDPTPQGAYAGNMPKCNNCPFYHNGACRELLCHNCKKKGHVARYCRAPAAAVTNPTPGVGASRACYGCGETGHLRRDCPKART